jgi:serine protease Do
VAQTEIGKKAKVVIVRNGKDITKEVRIGELKEDKEYAFAGEEGRKDVGMEVSELTRELARRYGISETRGVLVTYVEAESPAGEAGIREGDVILEVNRGSVDNVDEYYDAMREAKKGEKILLWVKRGSSSQYVVVTIKKG